MMCPSPTDSLRVHLLGTVSRDAMDGLQNWLSFELAGETGLRGVLLLAEHPPGVTMGAESSRDDVPEELREQAEWVSRGGGAIRHGAGVLTVSLLLPLERLTIGVGELRKRLETAFVAAMAEMKLACWSLDETPGLFCQRGQVGVFGMTVEQGISRFGMTLYVSGPGDVEAVVGNAVGEPMTTLTRLRGGPVAMGAVRQQLIEAIAAAFGYAEIAVFTGHEQLRRTAVKPAASREVR